MKMVYTLKDKWQRSRESETLCIMTLLVLWACLFIWPDKVFEEASILTKKLN